MSRKEELSLELIRSGLSHRQCTEYAYEQGRADAIDELLSKCEQYNYTLNSREFAKLIREQLKEQK